MADKNVEVKVTADTKSAASAIKSFESEAVEALRAIGKTGAEIDALKVVARDARAGKISLDSLDATTRQLVVDFNAMRQVASDKDLLGASSYRSAAKELKEARLAFDRLKASGAASAAEMQRASATIKSLEAAASGSAKELNKTADANNKIKNSAGGASAGMGMLLNAAKGFIGAQLATQVLGIVASFENLKRMMVGLFGDTQKAGKEFNYLTKTAQRLGVDVQSLTKSYTMLAAATRGTSLEGAATQRIFSSFAGAMTQMGASTEDLEGAMVQLSQGLSKGRFELEDIKAIMERIPGSAKVFSDSLGVTSLEFYEMISAGQLGRAEIEKMAIGLEKVYGKDTEIKGLSQSWNNFVSQLKLAAVEINESTNGSGILAGVMDGLSKTVSQVSGVISVSSDALKALTSSAGATAAAVSNMSFSSLKNDLSEIGGELSEKAGEKLRKVFLGIKDDSEKAGSAQAKVVSGSDSFRSAILDAAQAYTKTAAAATALVSATGEYGKAQVSAAQSELSRAQATGGFNDVLAAKSNLELVSAQAAQENAIQAQKLVAVTQARIDAVSAEIVALGNKKASTDAESLAQAESIQKLKEEQVELEKIQPKHISAAANLAALSIAQGESARQAQASAEAMRTEGANYDSIFVKQQQALQFLAQLKTAKTDALAADTALAEMQQRADLLEAGRAEAMQGTIAEREAYNLKVQETQSAIQALSDVIAGGASAEAALAAATDAVATANANALAALQARAATEQQQQTIAQQQLELGLKNNDLKKIELESRLAVAKARGNESEAQRLQNQLYRLEIERINAMVAAKKIEVQAMAEKVKLAEMEADLDGSRTEAEQRTIAIARQKLEIIKAEQAALQATANGKKEVLYATEAAKNAEVAHGAAAVQTAHNIQSQVTAKRNVAAVGDGGGGVGGGETATKLAYINSEQFKTQEARDVYEQMIKELESKKFSGMSTYSRNDPNNIFNALKNAEDSARAVDKDTQDSARKRKLAEEMSVRMSNEKNDTFQQSQRVVRFELSSPSGQKFSVNATGDSEAQLEAWLKSLEKGRTTAQ